MGRTVPVCSWNIFVKEGVVTWENQNLHYPTTGPDMPDFEPRGCPRGASFSWYLYSPLRVKYPYIRKALLDLWKTELSKTSNPVKAWDNIVTDPEKSKQYKQARGKGGTHSFYLERSHSNYRCFSNSYD